MVEFALMFKEFETLLCVLLIVLSNRGKIDVKSARRWRNVTFPASRTHHRFHKTLKFRFPSSYSVRFPGNDAIVFDDGVFVVIQKVECWNLVEMNRNCWILFLTLAAINSEISHVHSGNLVIVWFNFSVYVKTSKSWCDVEVMRRSKEVGRFF